ncbi:MAG: LytR/AlgR family response regulator transcription factor [Bacteroidia bacterium]
MIRCLAVDDEAYASEIIASYIKKTPFLELVGTTVNAFEAIEMVQNNLVDVVFLDIQMPELSGIQFLKVCGDKCKVILTTAYPEYAVEGFNLDVVDYLLKPVSYERFYKAAVKLQLSVGKPTSSEFMFVKGASKNKFVKLNYNEILYIEGLKNYVSIFTSSQRIITYQSLRDLENNLPSPPFFRVHKSYIISTTNVKMIEGNTVYIGDQSIPIGETYKEQFFKMIKQ